MTSVHLLNQPVVLDLGSGLTKGGYAGTPEPSAVIGTLAGRPRLPKVLPTSNATSSSVDPSYDTHANTLVDAHTPTSLLRASPQLRNYVVGDALHALSGVLSLHSPLDRGIVTDWAAAEQLWRHVTHDTLSVAPGEHPYLITEAPLNPRVNREKLAQFFFESLSAPAVHIALPPVLALFASGRTTGVVLDSGAGITTALPVAHGHCDIHSIRRVDLAGQDVTERMLTLLRKSGASLFSTSSERQAVRRMKERLAYVAVNPAQEELRNTELSSTSSGSLTKAFQLPDGNIVRIDVERFRAPEILFRPDLIGHEFSGMAGIVNSAISGVDIGLRRNLYASMVLAGGSTKFAGFAQRLLNEVRTMAPPDTKIRVHAPPDRLFSAFTGGTILASLSTTFRSTAVTRSEYYETGAAIVHRKTL